jgi:hypothetical protein
MAAETVIESFCERCGTRYTFEPARKRESRLVGLGKQLGILLEDHASGLAQRDPFHGTFHFCLECRQYTCPRCWNEAAGFCLGCMPLPDRPDSAALAAAEAEAGMEAATWMGQASVEHAALADPSAWPDADLHRGHPPVAEPAWPAVELATQHAEPAPDPTPEPAPLEEPEDSWSLTFEPESEPVVAAVEMEPEPAGVDHDASLDASDAAEPEIDLGRLAAVTGLAMLPELFDDEPAPSASGPEWDAAAPVDPADIIVLGAGAIADAEVDAEADAELEAELDAEAEAVADADVLSETEPVAETEAEADSVAEPEAEMAAEADLLAEAELEADAESEAEVATEADLVASAESQAEAEHVAEADLVAAAEVEPETEPLAEADLVASAEPEADAELEAGAEPEADAEAEAEHVAEADLVAAASVEPEAELLADADSEVEAEIVAEAELEADAELEAEAGSVAEAELEAEAEVEPEAELLAEAESEPELEAEALADIAAEGEPELVGAVEVQVASAVDDDSEADWADLFRRLPDAAEDEPAPDEWSAMAPWLGPDVAPVDPTPTVTPEPVTVAPAPPDPVVPAQPTVAWQITAPAPETEAKPAQWPPLGPVFRPQPAAPQPAPHPSVLARRPAAGGLLGRGQAPQASTQPVSNGVRPCINCELPLSANARFCRRCGRPQG